MYIEGDCCIGFAQIKTMNISHRTHTCNTRRTEAREWSRPTDGASPREAHLLSYLLFVQQTEPPRLYVRYQGLEIPMLIGKKLKLPTTVIMKKIT